MLIALSALFAGLALDNVVYNPSSAAIYAFFAVITGLHAVRPNEKK